MASIAPQYRPHSVSPVKMSSAAHTGAPFRRPITSSNAWGIVAPMVDTVEQAKSIIAACKYPPIGNRSIGGGMHAMNFGTEPAEYYQKWNDEVLVILQTESPLGVANAEAIYSLPGCDAIFVGPNDLRWQMKKLNEPEPTDAEFEAMLDRVVAAGKKVAICDQAEDAALAKGPSTGLLSCSFWSRMTS